LACARRVSAIAGLPIIHNAGVNKQIRKRSGLRPECTSVSITPHLQVFDGYITLFDINWIGVITDAL
jgi:hypothetical protein